MVRIHHARGRRRNHEVRRHWLRWRTVGRVGVVVCGVGDGVGVERRIRAWSRRVVARVRRRGVGDRGRRLGCLLRAR